MSLHHLQKEKKQLKRERTVAPMRTAILEGMTTKPVVIHTCVALRCGMKF